MASSKLPIYSALVANLAIAVSKFMAASFTGSSSMISEGIHSLVDTSNEVLLLLGLHKSKKPADAKRPFGYGRELYFWSYVVSISIFGIGGGISFYEGVTHLQHPVPIEDPIWNYIVLGIALVFDGISFIIALRTFNAQRGELGFWRAVRLSKDPSVFVVLFEDAADVLGLLVALAGVFLGHYLHNPYFDGAASIIIGLILASVSMLLAQESKSLLLGESAEPEVLRKVAALTETDPAVIKVNRLLSSYMSPEEVVLVIHIVFQPGLTTQAITDAVTRIQRLIQRDLPTIRQICIEPSPAEGTLPQAAPL